jgi:hypothetical protein
MTTFGDQVYQYGGAPVNGFMTTGKVWFVKPSTGSDGNSGKTPARALKTLAKAQTLATADKGDTVYMVAESNTAASTTDYQSSALAWAKDGVHLIGIGATPFVGQRARIAQLSTATNVDDLFTVSADNCFVSGLEIFQGVADNTSTGAMLVSGTRNRIQNCQISGIGHDTQDTNTNYSLKITASENYFKDNFIGLDTIIRDTAVYEIYILGTSTSNVARTVMDGCMISSWTSATAFKAIDATYVGDWFLLKNCTLNATGLKSGAVAPTGAIATTTPNGFILLHGSSVFGYADVCTADNANVFVSSYGGGVTGVVDLGVGKAVDIN